MPKKCTICGEKAEFRIKGSNDFYCKPCAEDYFSDLALLLKVEEEAKQLKKTLDKKIP